MEEKFNFIELVDKRGRLLAINIDQIVSISKTQHGCYIVTTKGGISTNESFEKILMLLPSVIKVGDIN